MAYTVNEGQPPLRNDGQDSRNITHIADDERADLVFPESNIIFRNRLVDMQRYTIRNREPVPEPPNTVNTTVINNIIQVTSGTSFKAKYVHAGTQGSITMRTKLMNNGSGVGGYDDNPTPVWNTTTSELVATSIDQVIELQLRFQSQTDTLGGAFEIELDKGGADPIIDIQEYDQTNQFQDYTIIFKVVSDADFVANNACIYIKPELGMTISISNLSFLILK